MDFIYLYTRRGRSFFAQTWQKNLATKREHLQKKFQRKLTKFNMIYIHNRLVILIFIVTQYQDMDMYSLTQVLLFQRPWWLLRQHQP